MSPLGRHGGGKAQPVVATGPWALRLVEAVSELVCLCRAGRIAYVNSAGARLLGFADPKAADGALFADFIHPDYRAILADGLDSLAGEAAGLPLKMVRRDGTAFDAELHVMAIEGKAAGDGDAVIVQARDVTERLRAAEAVLRSETRYRRLVEKALDFICVVEGGRIAFVNAAGVRMIGARAAGEIVGRPLADLFHPDYRDLVEAGLAEVAEEGAVPMKFVRLDGRTIEVEIAAMPFGAAADAFMLDARDISERVRTAETLRDREQRLRRAHDELEMRVEERTRELTQEIAERKRAEEKLRLAATVIETTNEAVLVADEAFRVTAVNPAFTAITGWTGEEIMGRQPPFMEALRRHEEMWQAMRQALAGSRHWEGEFWDVRRGGQAYAVRLSVSAIRGEDGRVRQYALLVGDITERKLAEEHIHRLANYDTLTELPNRTLFLDRLGQGVAACRRAGRRLGLMFIDLDGFKQVNDTLGHAAGDLLLREAASRLKRCVRDCDTVARLGGDEFTVVLPGIGGAADVAAAAQRVLDALTRPFLLEGQEARVSGSVGIALFPDDATGMEELLTKADTAMYRAKGHGKANYQFFADLGGSA
jgi:diguanylate cyclase (GGDEF)-like protein/PAS domain S-box-containing protein